MLFEIKYLVLLKLFNLIVVRFVLLVKEFYLFNMDFKYDFLNDIFLNLKLSELFN